MSLIFARARQFSGIFSEDRTLKNRWHLNLGANCPHCVRPYVHRLESIKWPKKDWQNGIKNDDDGIFPISMSFRLGKVGFQLNILLRAQTHIALGQIVIGLHLYVLWMETWNVCRVKIALVRWKWENERLEWMHTHTHTPTNVPMKFVRNARAW